MLLRFAIEYLRNQKLKDTQQSDVGNCSKDCDVAFRIPMSSKVTLPSPPVRKQTVHMVDLGGEGGQKVLKSL